MIFDFTQIRAQVLKFVRSHFFVTTLVNKCFYGGTTQLHAKNQVKTCIPLVLTSQLQSKPHPNHVPNDCKSKTQVMEQAISGWGGIHHSPTSPAAPTHHTCQVSTFQAKPHHLALEINLCPPFPQHPIHNTLKITPTASWPIPKWLQLIDNYRSDNPASATAIIRNLSNKFCLVTWSQQH